MAAVETETKGAIYETFVNLALQRAFPGEEVHFHPHLPGVFADQDAAVQWRGAWALVVGVTFWGSHETAKMKFWRIHEDVFEVHETFPKVLFLHVLFESAGETSLAALVRAVCGGAAVDDADCPALRILQRFVETDAAVKSFGEDALAVSARCRDLLASDSTFQAAIDQLADRVRSVVARREADAKGSAVLHQARRPDVKGNHPKTFHFSGARATSFKETLLRLLDLAAEELAFASAEYRRGGLDALREVRPLRDSGSVRLEGLCARVIPTAELTLALQNGEDWCQAQQMQLRQALLNPDHPASSYLEHVRDVSERGLCEARLERLLAATSPDAVIRLLQDQTDGRRRCWPLDYFMAIEREHIKGRKFGFSKLSAQLGTSYRGGISDLPRFAAGDSSRLTAHTQRLLAGIMTRRMAEWRLGKATAEVVRSDRRTTLRKKLPALDLLLFGRLRSGLSGVKIEPNWLVDHPLSARCANRAAGRTAFNFRLTGPKGAALLFVVSSGESTHKHKEVSGRLRAAWATKALSPATRAYLIVDGVFLAEEETAAARCAMLHRAGWDGAFFPDELDHLLNRLAADLGGLVTHAEGNQP